MRFREKMILIAAIAAAGLFIFHIAHYMLYCRYKRNPEKSHCAVCGEIIVAQKTVDKAPHTVVADKAVAPTCMSTGLSEGSH